MNFDRVTHIEMYMDMRQDRKPICRLTVSVFVCTVCFVACCQIFGFSHCVCVQCPNEESYLNLDWMLSTSKRITEVNWI